VLSHRVFQTRCTPTTELCFQPVYVSPTHLGSSKPVVKPALGYPIDHRIRVSGPWQPTPRVIAQQREFCNPKKAGPRSFFAPENFIYRMKSTLYLVRRESINRPSGVSIWGSQQRPKPPPKTSPTKEKSELRPYPYIGR
jgi:hypothetical protein